MRKPSSLYSPAISSYVKKTEDWENKLPLESISEIQYKDKTMFDLLPFKKGLSFSDCLYALLSVHGKDTRSILVRWAIEDYSPEDESKLMNIERMKMPFGLIQKIFVFLLSLCMLLKKIMLL